MGVSMETVEFTFQNQTFNFCHCPTCHYFDENDAKQYKLESKIFIISSYVLTCLLPLVIMSISYGAIRRCVLKNAKTFRSPSVMKRTNDIISKKKVSP